MPEALDTLDVANRAQLRTELRERERLIGVNLDIGGDIGVDSADGRCDRRAGGLHDQEAYSCQRQGQQGEGGAPALAKDAAQPQPYCLRDPCQALAQTRHHPVAVAGAHAIGGEGITHADARAVPQRQQRREEGNAEANSQADDDDPPLQHKRTDIDWHSRGKL